jgi:hypothetical protein
MQTLLALSAIALAIPLTIFLAVLAFFYRKSMKEKHASNRGMFGFNDGKFDRWVDPISVMMSFEAHKEFRADIHPRQAMLGNKQAIETMLDAIRKAFAVVDYESPMKPGLTVNEMFSLFRAFYEWVDVQKKSIQLERTYVEYTEQMSRASAKETTNYTSDSGSTDIADSQNNPSPCGKEPSHPSG